MSNVFHSYDTLALALSALIFLITVFLLITRTIGFWITLLLLCFSLATGIIVGNFGALGEYFRSPKEKELAELKERVDHLYEHVKEKPKDQATAPEGTTLQNTLGFDP